ncbi:MAG: hypothetical protein GF383_13570 [Candidatus Lokiarchaeota archaeon]|nr:hypothetical protein [Candidatus Lokiarchaeota archaeon]MBD3342254.1 hypothetical protein [Candidatus Lokiarchaeota archaeon]
MVKLVWNKPEKISSKSNREDLNFELIERTENSKINRKEGLNRSSQWANKLFWSDNIDVLNWCLKNLKKKIDLVYIDPPFFSGTNYEIEISHEDENFDSIAYRDRWGNNLDSYLHMLFARLKLIKKVLSEKGLIFFHCDWHASHYIRVLLDNIFGRNNFVNNIVWYYYNKYSAGKSNLPRAHDDIFIYSKSKNYTFNEIRIPRDKPRKQLKRVMVNGVLKNAKDENGNVIYRIVNDKKLDDVWRIPCMQPASKQWTGFPTQKHHKLLERILELGSIEGDLIADFFCGSGTSAYMAEKMGRRWIVSDISKYSIYLTRQRLLALKEKQRESALNSYPFEILTHMNEDKQQVMDSGFFAKELTIKRKK